MRPGRFAAAAFAALALTACRTTVGGQPLPARALVASVDDFADAAADHVALHYYGNGGWGIQWKGEYVMAAPYFTNGLLRASDPKAVARGLNGTPVARARLVFAGHGHYDHVGDLAEVLEHVETRPVVVVVNQTTWHGLAAVRDPERRKWIALDPLQDSGRWLDERAAVDVPLPREIRIMPILSDHAPHLAIGHVRMTALFGRETEDRTEVPKHIGDFLVGYTWAFLIDLMDRDRIAFRILYQDAAASPPNGFPPEVERKRRPVDVNIVCVPGSDAVLEHPEKLLAETHTRYVLLGHWESFFRSRDRRLAPIRFNTDGDHMDRLLARVAGAIGTATKYHVAPESVPRGPHGDDWALPVPGETFRFSLPHEP